MIRDASSRQALPQPTPTWLPASEMGAWDALVERHAAGAVYHTSAWWRVLEEAFQHMEGHFLVLRDPGDGVVLAGIPLYVVRSRILGHRVVTIPFASFCDPLVRTREDFERMLPMAEELRRRARGGYWEMRVRHSAGSVPAGAFSETAPFRHHLIHLQGGEAAIWPRLSRTAVRRMVSRARKDGLRVVPGTDEMALRSFQRLSAQSRRRLGLPPMPDAFFASIVRHLGPRMSSLLLALKGDEVIAASLALKYRDIYILEYAGEAEGVRQSGAPQLLYWEAVREACAAGCTWFSLGRTAKSNTGLLLYKDHWATEAEDLSVYVSPVARARESVGGGLSNNAALRWVFRNAPAPVRRQLGAFCYRHWG